MIQLESSDLFRDLPPGDVQELRQHVHEQSYAKGQDVFRAGEPGDGVYVVKSGRIEISGHVNPETRLVFSVVGPGQIFGEMAVIEQQPRSATANVPESATVYFIPRSELLKLMVRSPGLSLKLLQLVSHRLREFNQHYLKEVVEAERLSAVGRFARSIVHDLKNPLNIISLSVDVACSSTAKAGMRENSRVRIHKQVNRINDLIGDILQFAQANRPEEQKPMNYAEFVHLVVNELRPDLELKSMRLVMDEPPPAVTVRIDPKRMRRVFVNLTHNACDAIAEHGVITLRFRIEGGDLITELRDNGPGIAPEIAGKLFEAFATHGKSHGTGLGLSICKRITTDHGGRIWAANADGGGAVFAFALPLSS